MKIVLSGKTFWLNWHHLYCFYVVAREGTIAKASEDLGIGAPALSIQIKQLEASLARELFSRTGRRLRLTEDGQIAYDYCTEIFGLGRELVETLSDRISSKRTHVQISSLDTIPKHLTLEIVSSALERGDCTLTISEGRLSDMLEDLAANRLDLIVTNTHPETPAGRLISKKIARFPLFIVGAPQFKNLRRNFPKSLDGQPFVIPTSESRVRQEFENFVNHEEITPQLVAEVQDIMIQKLMAVKGMGLTIAPEFAIRDCIENKELVLIGQLPAAYEDLYLIAAQRRVRNPIVDQLMKSFRAT
jgi:LysR family transcriptional regulator, transcriptional activator of nhaA